MDGEPDGLQSLGHKESDTAERLTLFPFNKDLRPLDQRSRPRESNSGCLFSNPSQSSWGKQGWHDNDPLQTGEAQRGASRTLRHQPALPGPQGSPP